MTTVSQRLGLPLELFPYQVEGVRAIVKKFGGRALLADEMGLGKSAQALATAAFYKEWPLVVVCPSSLRLNWKKEALLWLPAYLSEVDICVVRKGSDKLYGRMLIFSYEMAAKRAGEILALKPQMVVLDEAHYIKNKTAQRTKRLVPLCRAAPRCILLTGTPVLNRPIELWTQLEALNRSFGKYWEYAQKYCNLKRGRFGWDVSGARNLPELNERLRSTVMVRRLKRDVLTQLPPKRRVKIVVEGVGRSTELEVIRGEVRDALAKANGNMELARELLRKKTVKLSSIIFKAYSLIGAMKAEHVVSWTIDNSSSDSPLVVFAHHKLVLDAICRGLTEQGVSWVRIDGSTKLDARQDAVEKFQGGKAQVAVLSITAASTGITLTRSSDMLIAELPFGPGLAAQAEDRIHRVGQKNAALIRYMIAERTLDESLWRLINRKSEVTHAALDGHAQSSFEASAEESSGDYWIVVEETLQEEFERMKEGRAA